MTTFEVVVDVATGWTSPTAPRELDAPAIADQPDLAAWTQSLDGAARLGLHGRTLTQLVRGEPVLLIEQAGEWVKVAAPGSLLPRTFAAIPAGYAAPTSRKRTSHVRLRRPIRSTSTRGRSRGSPVSSLGCPICGEAPRDGAWTAPAWCTWRTGQPVPSYPGMPRLNKPPPYRWNSGRSSQATSTSSPVTTAFSMSGSSLDRGACCMLPRTPRTGCQVPAASRTRRCQLSAGGLSTPLAGFSDRPCRR